MKRAAIYTRQSLDKTGEGLAVARQLKASEQLCGTRGWEIVARLSDNDMSGYSGKPRPGYQQLVAMMEARRLDVVVVWAVDRLTRRLADLVELIDLCENTGVKVATVSGDLDLSNDQGRLVARILGSVAQGEVERKSTRQKAAAQQAAEAGRVRRSCPQPFGWQRDRITVDPAERAAVESACRALLSGGTIAGIIRDWTARGVIPHRSGGEWTGNSVVTILRNPRNAGISTYRGAEVGRGEWQPLISEEMFRAVVQVLDDPARRRKTMGVRTLLGALALCRCGNTVTARVNQRGTRVDRVYRCTPATREGRPGPHVATRSAEVDEFVGQLVIARLSRPDAASLVAPRQQGDVGALRDESRAIRTRLARLGPNYALGVITEQDMIAGRAAGEARLAEIEARLADLGRESVLAPLVASQNVAAAWETLSTDRRRAVIDTLMTVTLQPQQRGAREFDPESVVHIEWRQDV